MEETPNFEAYSYEALLEVYETLDEKKYPERKARVAELLEERKDTDEAQAVIEGDITRAKYSTFGPRFVAGFIDGSCLTAIAYALGVVLGFFPDWLVNITGYVTTFDVYIYSVVLHGLYGQTLGKAVMSVKVVNFIDEAEITFKQAFIRDCVPIAVLGAMLFVVALMPVDADGNLPSSVEYVLIFSGVFHFLWFLIEIVTMLSNEKRRALHDYLADTVVINI